MVHSICKAEGCNTKILVNTALCPSHKVLRELSEPQPDTKQLREEIVLAIFGEPPNEAIWAMGTRQAVIDSYAKTSEVKRILALIKKSNTELLEALEEALPEQEPRPESGAQRNGTAQAVRKARNKALNEVATTIKQFKGKI